MKRIVLASLFTAVVSQAAGCIFVSDDDDEPARIYANWTFRNINGTTTGCPPMFDTVQLWSQLVTANGTPVGNPVPDLFDCVDGTGRTAPLEADRYQVWVEVRTDSLSTLYAKSLSKYTDLFDADQTLSFDIYNDAGYFSVSWALEDAIDNTPISCAEALAARVALTPTLLPSNTLAPETEWPCSDGFGVTVPLAVGMYGGELVALEAGGAAIDPGYDLTTQTINGENDITDLGMIMIPVE